MSDTPITDGMVMSKFATQADLHKAVRERCRQFEKENAYLRETAVIENRLAIFIALSAIAINPITFLMMLPIYLAAR